MTSFNTFGTPKLKPMFAEIFKRYDSTFYGFCNGDILFIYTLVSTLKGIKEKLTRFNDNVLVIGQRKNLNINFTQPVEIYENSSSIYSLGRNARLYKPDAVDYFIFSTGNLLNWNALADVVIGRPAYRNYIVGTAMKTGVNVIDATRTLLALHLSNPNVLFESSGHKDANYNSKIIGKFNYRSRMTLSAKLYTNFDTFRDVFVARR